MSGETADQESGWSVDTLKAYFEMRVNSLSIMLEERYRTQTLAMETALTAAEKAVGAALLATEKAITKADLATEKRFESVNEFRSQLADQAATFMPRTESISRHDRTSEQLLSVMAKIDDESSRGSEQRQAMENRLMALITAISSRLDLTQGRSTGLSDGWGYIIGAIGLVGAVIGIVLGLR